MDARKRVLYSATSIVLSITTVLSILFTLFPIQASGNTLPDFSRFVTSYTLTVKDSHNNVTDSAYFDKDSANVTLPAVQIGDGTKVAFSMTFALADIVSAAGTDSTDSAASTDSGDHVAGNSYAMSLPAAFTPQNVGSTDIKIDPGDGSGLVTIGSWSLTSGVLTVTFDSNADNYFSRQGCFNISSTFQASQLASDSGGVIPFQIGAFTVNLPIWVTAPATAPTIQKTGTYSGGAITWIVTVNSGNDGFNGGLTDVTVTDTLSDNQTFWDSAVTKFGDTILKDSDMAPGYRVNNSTVTFHLGDMAHNQTKQLVYTTHVKYPGEKPVFPNTAVLYTNTAVLGADGIGVNPPTARVSATNASTVGSWITKTQTGTMTKDSGGRINSIPWTITVNKGGNGVIPAGTSAAAVTDTLLSPYLSLSGSISLKVNGVTTTLDQNDTKDVYYSLGTSSDPATAGNQVITIHFQNTDITDEQDLTFNTSVDPAYYNTNHGAFSNTATLSQGGNTATSAAAGAQGTGSSVISKTGVSYNAATHLATWKITVNTNQMAMTSPTVTDTIDPRGGQSFSSISAAQNSVSLSPASNEAELAPGKYYLEKTDNQHFTVHLSDFKNGDAPVVLTVVTEVTSPDYYGVNSSLNVYNSASLATGSGISGSSNASQAVKSTVIDKEAAGYSYSTKTLTWTITVNQNQMLMKNAVVTDTLPGDVTFQGITLADGNNTGKAINGASGPVPYYTLVGQTLTVYLDDLGVSDLGVKSAQRIITVTATMSDTALAGHNALFSESNTASLHFASGPSSDPSSSCTQSIDQSIVEKTGTYDKDTNQANWVVIINKNQVSASALGISASTAVSLKDTLPSGLILDPNSVKLYHLSWGGTNGKWAKGTEIPLILSDSVKYNPTTRLFTFTFPSGTDFSSAYELDFSTDITTGGNYTNSITMDGITQNQTGQSGSVVVQNQDVTTWFTGTLRPGTAAVTKLDAITGKPVPGTTFTLYQSGIPIQTGITNAQGKLTFSSLKQGQTYTVQETAPAPGYQNNSTVWTILVTSSNLNQSYTFTDEKTPASSQASSSSQPESSSQASSSSQPESSSQASNSSQPESSSQASSSSQPVSSIASSSSASSQSHSGGNGGGTSASSQESSTGSAVSSGISSQGSSSAPGGSSGSKPTVTSGTQGVGGWNASAGGAIYIKKADADGNALSGAEFTLSGADGTVIAKKVTGSGGLLAFRNLEPGDYSVRETKAPQGYERYDSPLAVTLADGQEAGYTLKDGLKGSASSGVLGWYSDDTLPKTGETPVAPFLLAAGVLLMFGGFVVRKTENSGRKMRHRRR